MISIAGHSDIVGIYYQGKDIVRKYYGQILVWEKIRCCFGKGYWVNALPWVNEIGWKNTP